MTKQRWTRLGATRGALIVRGVLSAVVFGLAVFSLLAVIDSSERGWAIFVWPAIYAFCAWRFARLGVYTSEWGVRINSVVTWWYPWRKIDHFELGRTGEMFARNATAIVLVTTSGRRRLAWGTATSTRPIRTSGPRQDAILDALNERLAGARAAANR